MAPDEHDCPLSVVVEEQRRRIDELLERAQKQEREIAQLKKALIGPKSERTKMPSVQAALGAEPVSADNRKARRRERALQREQLETVRVEHRVPDEQRCCPKCGADTLSPLGEGRTTAVYEYVPAKLVRVVHVQEVLRCRCGGHIVTAPGAPKVVEQGRYGASLLAHLVVAKCVDSIPIYRIEKDFKRQGVPLSRSTLNDLFHRAAEIITPLSARLLERIRTRPIVLADETRMRMLDGGGGKPKNGFHWTFVAEDEAGDADVAFVFAADRSGETPIPTYLTSWGPRTRGASARSSKPSSIISSDSCSNSELASRSSVVRSTWSLPARTTTSICSSITSSCAVTS